MKIVIAPDSFKGSVSAFEAAMAIELGVKKSIPGAETLIVPLADGGEGTVDTLVAATGGKKNAVTVTGPLGSPVEAFYGVLGDGKTCVIEIAETSGLDLVPEKERNPLVTTTYGTGELIKSALAEGYRSFILALGGSATNDGGAGMLQALGMKILDEEKHEIGFGGGELSRVDKISLRDFDSRINESNFVIASDVENPLVGKNGASFVFGPQKGATPDIVRVLDKNLKHWANKIKEVTGVKLHNLPGAGAAGGIGGAFQAFFPSVIEKGADVVMDYTKLKEKLVGADLLITGEGQVDFQTAFGKTPMRAALAAKKLGVPTIIIAGSIGKGIESLYRYGVISIHSIVTKPMTLDKAMESAPELLEQTAAQICRTFFYMKHPSSLL
ncbi:MAG TPA: glycerate kinase [Bacillus bacterium]|uniref:glycerate kinase family protein n=1 Tax=Siminovitchia fordii TaxID=254759 RepID=UPI000526A5FF|nr:glycerate kinase [Siminovitchia fordii]HBZ11511.1 glycerate kinase [Bacillus sp. (in: firmicutes)]